jgi:signal transduction histidine kinase
MATGETKYGDTLLRVPAAHRDGRRLSIEFSVALLRDADGKIAGIAAIIRDATERWTADRELRARLAAAERRLRELTGPAGPAGPGDATTE